MLAIGGPGRMDGLGWEQVAAETDRDTGLVAFRRRHSNVVADLDVLDGLQTIGGRDQHTGG